MKSRFTFNGIRRATSPASAQPGDCLSIVNLKQKSGSLVPAGSPEVYYKMNDPDCRLLYIHNCYDGEHYISADQNLLYHEAFADKETQELTKISEKILVLESPVTSIQSIGNTLIVVCSEKVYYLLYKNNAYSNLGERPEIPEISFYPYTKYTDAYNVSEYTFMKGYNTPTRLDTEDINYFNTAYYNAFFQLQEKAWDRYYFVQPILIRYALKLYDGSYLYASSPVMLAQPDPIQPCRMSIRLKNSNELCTGSSQGQIIAGNYSISYFVHSINLNDWSDIVKSIDIYATPEATIFEPDQKQQGLTYKINRTESNGIVSFVLNGDISFLDQETIQKRYLQSPLFYKIASIENYTELEIGHSYDIDNKIRPDMLVHEEVLSPDNTTLLSTGAQVSYVYNKRLHLANLTRKLFPGFPLSLFRADQRYTGVATAYIVTYLKTERGESRVVWSGQLNFYGVNFSPLLSYPDSNAYQMDIAVKFGTMIYRGSFPLTPSEYENRADYLEPSLTPIVLKSDPSGGSSLVVPQPENDTYLQNNILRVSKPENPFSFPAELTYAISNKDIIGIATVTSALSEGQFGEFPLYLFTEEGIWALQNGSGETCYGLQHQLSREPLSKDYPIIPLEEAVVFTSNKGLSFLQGATVQSLLSFDEIIYEDNNLVKFQDISETLLLSTYDSTPLSQYIKKSIMAYNSLDKELIFCQPGQQYSIVLYLPTLYMYRTTQTYTSFLSDTSHLLGQNQSGVVYNLREKATSFNQEVSILSRPISFQSDTLQRWREISLRAYNSIQNVVLSLWGGHDPEDAFTCVGQISCSRTLSGRVTLRVTGPAYKYYRIIMTGIVSSDFHLDAVDVIFNLIAPPYRLR
ncbi:hypothetical protein [Barnesiella viscericola]|uniref:hypothetical protein n=1 Tax=Barnesiella viscericola TaxID=397865 RepID=UPI00235614DB|nr:hypothetical protein [Barnesiella viscericola]